MASLSQLQRLDERIETADDILRRATKFLDKKIDGSSKLLTKIRAELKFLRKIKSGKIELKEDHLNSTNLTSLQALISVIEQIPSAEAILEAFHFSSDKNQEFFNNFDEKQTLNVDIVCENGTVWVKVIARNAKALLTVWEGRGCFGEKSLETQAKLYLNAADANPTNFRPPKIYFVFCKGAPQEITEGLESRGISVKGTILGENLEINYDNFLIDFESLNFDNEQNSFYENNLVNLDVTALLCLVSNLCHGYCDFDFEIPVLSEQASEERKSKVLPKLQKFLGGKSLYSCKTAVESFREIVKTIAGPKETKRANELLERITIVNDQPSERTLLLCNSGKINERSKIIFGTGDSLKAVTVTANTGFVRAAAQSGEKFDVFIHEARALTENKESTAKSL